MCSSLLFLDKSFWWKRSSLCVRISLFIFSQRFHILINLAKLMNPSSVTYKSSNQNSNINIYIYISYNPIFFFFFHSRWYNLSLSLSEKSQFPCIDIVFTTEQNQNFLKFFHIFLYLFLISTFNVFPLISFTLFSTTTSKIKALQHNQ